MIVSTPRSFVLWGLSMALLLALIRDGANDGHAPKLDAAAWGDDHVGKPVPEFISGDECLFCHRQEVGSAWAMNRHARSLRAASGDEPAVLAIREHAGTREFGTDVTMLLGEKRRVRFLKASGEYGKLAVLSTSWQPSQGEQRTSEKVRGQVVDAEAPRWDIALFADSCAGCHATAVDPTTRAFASPSLDCFVCHGDATLEHSKDAALMPLAKSRRDPARVVTSICASCHLRGGKSKSIGRPYPNNFVAGDNLFRDFAVDLSDAAIAKLNPADRHVLENARDVVIIGKNDVTCLSCHEVHKQSSLKHRRVADSGICLNCHQPTGPKSARKPYQVHSARCRY